MSAGSRRWNNFLDLAHKTAVNILFVGTMYGAYLGYQGYKQSREFRKEWSKYNKYYELDPYYTYNPDFMRHQGYEEEQIALTRPQFHAAKALREIYQIPLQPPYEPLPIHIATNGNPIKEGPYANVPTTSTAIDTTRVK